MDAVREVKVMVFWAARETRLTSTPKRWMKTANAAARWTGSNDRFSVASKRSESSTNTAGWCPPTAWLNEIRWARAVARWRRRGGRDEAGLGQRTRLQVARRRFFVATLGDLGEELVEGERGQDGVAGQFGEQGAEQRVGGLPRRRWFHDDARAWSVLKAFSKWMNSSAAIIWLAARTGSSG